jgi:hypothetical protein
MTQGEMMDTTVCIGIVRSPDHLNKLEEIAAWLDQNKFSCTLSVVDNRATLDITGGDESVQTKEEFDKYVMEIVIHTLVKHMD